MKSTQNSNKTSKKRNVNKKKKKVNFGFLIALVAILALGILMGIIIQQGITQATIVKGMEAFSGTINIDLNETEMVDRLFEILNETGELEK